MKKSLLNKMTKAASVALLTGAMVCGAGLVSSNSANANGIPGLTISQINRLIHAGNKADNMVVSAYNHTYSTTHSDKKAAKAVKNAYRKAFAGKKVVNKNNKRVVRHHASKRSAARHAALRRVASAKKAARLSLRRRAVKPMNRRAYRAHRLAVKNFRHSRYYHNVWSRAEKINKRAVRVDQARLNKTNKANSSKHLTKYEHSALNSSIKAQQHHINYMMGYVNHDAHMLSLAK